MRKEVILALVIGIIIGAVVLFGIRLANSSATPRRPEPTTPLVSPTTAPQPANPLTITTPTNHAVVFSADLPIKGASLPDSTIIVVSEEDEKIIDADKSGHFETEIKLTGGENNILINAFSSDTLIASASIQIIYTTQTIE